MTALATPTLFTNHRPTGVEAFVENRFRQISVIAGAKRLEERWVLFKDGLSQGSNRTGMGRRHDDG